MGKISTGSNTTKSILTGRSFARLSGSSSRGRIPRSKGNRVVSRGTSRNGRRRKPTVLNFCCQTPRMAKKWVCDTRVLKTICSKPFRQFAMDCVLFAVVALCSAPFHLFFVFGRTDLYLSFMMTVMGRTDSYTPSEIAQIEDNGYRQLIENKHLLLLSYFGVWLSIFVCVEFIIPLRKSARDLFSR